MARWARIIVRSQVMVWLLSRRLCASGNAARRLANLKLGNVSLSLLSFSYVFLL